jgi:hypothetical protein
MNILKLYALLISVFHISLLYFFFGFYWDEGQNIHANILYGTITEPPYELWINESMMFQYPIISYLSNTFSTTPVYGLWHLVIMVLYVSVFAYLFLFYIQKFTKFKLYIFTLSILSLFALTAISSVYIYPTRDSILLTTAAVLLFFSDKNENKFTTFFSLCLFFIGFSLRVNSALLVLILLTIFFSLYLNSILKSLNLLKFHWLIAVFLQSIFLIYYSNSENKGVQIEITSYELALSDRHAMVSLDKMTNRKDSSLYMALNHDFFADSAQITKEFLGKMVNHDVYLKPNIKKTDMEHLNKALKGSAFNYWGLYLFYFALLSILLSKTKPHLIYKIIAFNIASFSMMGLIAMKVSMVDHLLLPWTVSSLILSIFFIVTKTVSFERKQTASFLSTLILMAIYVFLKLSNFTKDESDNYIISLKYINEVSELAENNTLLVWHSLDFLPKDIFSRSESEGLRKAYFLNIGLYTYREFAQKRIINDLGFSPLDFKSMHNKLVKHDYILLLRDDLATFLPYYYKEIYNLDIQFDKKTTFMPKYLEGIGLYSVAK